MAATTRTPAQCEHDRAEIARRYFRGELQAVIGKDLGLSKQMVSYDLAVLVDRWRVASMRAITDAKAEELARINHLEVTYWEAWEDSKLDREIATQRATGTGDATKREATVRKEGQSGNPAFLAGVQWCVDRRCKLLGLDAPARTITTLVTVEDADNMSLAELDQVLMDRGVKL